jgi:hypothetical protein
MNYQIEIYEKNIINKNNELKILRKEIKIYDEDISMRMGYIKKMKKQKILRLEEQCRKLRIIINQIQIELRDAIENQNDKEIDRLIEVRGYYMRDLKNTEKELSSMF